MNSVFVVAGEPLESVLDFRQVAETAKRVPLAQTTLVGTAGSFEPVATLE